MKLNTITIEKLERMVGEKILLPSIEAIDKTSIIRYAQALSDLNPLYINEGYTWETNFNGCVAPPTFIFDVIPAKSELGDDGRDLTKISIPGYKLLRGGNEYEFFKSVKPGDSIERKMKIDEVYRKKSEKLGFIIFVVYTITYKNQKKEIVGINRETLMFYK